MDKKAFYNLTYGLFVVSTKFKDKTNGCISNVCVQVANDPPRVALSLQNNNYTTELLKESGEFTVSVLDTSCRFEVIKHFGMQSGRSVDKFNGVDYKNADNGIPYLTNNTVAVVVGKVAESHNIGSHTLFIADVKDAFVINENSQPMTYAYYQNNVKPKVKKEAIMSDKKIIGWKCTVCGYEYKGEKLPDDYVCPLCGVGADSFEPIYE